MFIEVCVQDCQICAVGRLRPERADVLDVLFFVDQLQLRLSYLAVDAGHVLDFGMVQIPDFGQMFDDGFDSHGSLGMFPLAAMVGHPAVVDDACFAAMHGWRMINIIE